MPYILGAYFFDVIRNDVNIIQPELPAEPINYLVPPFNHDTTILIPLCWFCFTMLTTIYQWIHIRNLDKICTGSTLERRARSCSMVAG